MGMVRGEVFNHNSLGEVMVEHTWLDGSITVVSASIPPWSTTNVFRLRKPLHPGYWPVNTETRHQDLADIKAGKMVEKNRRGAAEGIRSDYAGGRRID